MLTQFVRRKASGYLFFCFVGRAAATGYTLHKSAQHTLIAHKTLAADYTYIVISSFIGIFAWYIHIQTHTHKLVE